MSVLVIIYVYAASAESCSWNSNCDMDLSYNVSITDSKEPVNISLRRFKSKAVLEYTLKDRFPIHFWGDLFWIQSDNMLLG
jgi:hypothetical protein